jgi:serine protease
MYRARTRRTQLAVTSLEARDVPAVAGALQVDPNQYAADRIIVKLTPPVIPMKPVAPASPLTNGADSLGFGLYSVHLRKGVTVDRALKYFHARANVAIAEPDYTVHADLIPNDPNFGNLYGLNNTGQTGGTPDDDIDAPEAWDVSTGSGNMVVAVIDTGINYNHPDLAANMWHNPGEIAGDGIDNDGDGIVDDVYGADFANNDGDPMDDNGHGTHVSGTIGAVGDNGVGVAGINWHVQLMAVKFLASNGSGSISNAVKCLNYAVAHGAKVSNNSWGGGGFSSAMSSAIDAARAAGDIFVAAAGNGGSDGIGDNNDSVANYPSNYPQDNVLAVAATDQNDNLASFSNFGPTTVDLAAPGVNIYSTYGSSYATLSGTSMATPHVTGAVALVWDAHPTWSYSDVITALKSTVDPKPSLTGKVASGGRLNVNAAIRFGTTPPADTVGPKVTSATSSGTSGISTVRVTFNEAIAAASFDVGDATLAGPGGTVGASSVAPVSATQFDVGFPTQTAVGSYALTVGPGVSDTAGNPMNQDGDAVNGEVPDDQYTTTFTISSTQTFNSTDVNKPIADVSRTISVLDVGPSMTINDINVKLNLSHTYDSDLRITLVAPDGTQVILVNRRGGSGDNFTNTVLDDQASRSISQGTAPFTGTFRPEQALSAFNGKNASGRWQLWIDDLARFDTGRVNAWSLTIS